MRMCTRVQLSDTEASLTSSVRKLPSAMTPGIAAAAGISQYSSLDEKIAKMRKMKHKADDNDIDDDDDDDDGGSDAMDADEDASSADERHLKQGMLTLM